MTGKQLIPKGGMIQKIRAALKARGEEDPDLVICARTDARSVSGLEDTIERATAYAGAGADYVYVEPPQSLEEVEKLVREIPAPLAFNIIPGGKTPPFEVRDLEERGVKYLSVPMVCLYSATKAMIEALRELKETRDVARIMELGVSWAEFNEIIGLRRWRQLELKALSEGELMERYGTLDLEEIISKELDETDKVWKGQRKR